MRRCARKKRAPEFLEFSKKAEEKYYMTVNKTKTTMPEDLVCLSHLRWGFVYQRPQHLLSRFAKQQRVFFIEEPVPSEGAPRMQLHTCPDSGVTICVPQIPESLGRASQDTIQKLLLTTLFTDQKISDYLLWS